MNRFRCLPVAFLLFTVCSFANAQNQTKGVITGRVVTDEGSGLPGVTVRLTPAGAPGFSAGRTTSTDEDGNFRLTDLPPGAFSIRAEPGRAFVPAPQPASERARLRYARPGDSVTLTMMRGGVITGRVTNAANEAIIALPLGAIQVRDAEGNPVAAQAISAAARAYTDDRGIYRFYGLTPGTYIVLANTGNPYFGSQASLFDNDAPTYYPSSTRDTAAEIQVAGGGEITGIDIRYRGERGHAVSGKLIGNPNSASVSLLHAGTGAQIASSRVYRGGSDAGFDFYGVPDDEYELMAQTDSEADNPLASQPRRVSVRGADVTGVELRMLPMGTIAGRVVLEPAQAACDKPAKPRLEEIALAAFPEIRPKRETESAFKPNPVETLPNEKGEFSIHRLFAGRYWLAPDLPNEGLFVKSISVAPAAKSTTTAKPTAAATDTNLARTGIALKQGERLTGVTVTLSEGAAGLRGKIVAEKVGAQLPSRLRVHLIPAEVGSGEDVLHYGEVMAHTDGGFAFANLPPGKYWLLARAAAEEEPANHPAQPAARHAVERARLRKEAEAAKIEIELRACQRVTDQLVKFGGGTK